MARGGDLLLGIQINAGGTYTLFFESGREVEIDELYKDNGRLLSFDEPVRGEVEKGDFSRVGVVLDAAQKMEFFSVSDEVQIGRKASLSGCSARSVKELTDGKYLVVLGGGLAFVSELFEMEEDKNASRQDEADKNAAKQNELDQNAARQNEIKELEQKSQKAIAANAAAGLHFWPKEQNLSIWV